jgi:hypothetical protein
MTVERNLPRRMYTLIMHDSVPRIPRSEMALFGSVVRDSPLKLV